MYETTPKGAYLMPNKTSESHLRANVKYDKENTVRVVMNVNKRTMSDVIDALDASESKQGYIVSLIRSDCYRKHSNHLILNGKDLDYISVSKYAEEIERIYPTFRQLADQQALAYVESQFVENTPAHVIVSEYLRSTDTDPIIINCV